MDAPIHNLRPANGSLCYPTHCILIECNNKHAGACLKNKVTELGRVKAMETLKEQV